jgi:hypothetical protein
VVVETETKEARRRIHMRKLSSKGGVSRKRRDWGQKRDTPDSFTEDPLPQNLFLVVMSLA